jgi:hypothetical protein
VEHGGGGGLGGPRADLVPRRLSKSSMGLSPVSASSLWCERVQGREKLGGERGGPMREGCGRR